MNARHLTGLVLIMVALGALTVIAEPLVVIGQSEEEAIGGSWTVEAQLSRESITTGEAEGADISLVATFHADAEEVANINSLSARRTSPSGGLLGLVEAADPQLFGFGLHAGGTFLHKYIVSVPVEPDCVAESDSQGSLNGTLTCQVNASDVEGVNLFAKEGAAPGDYTVGFAPTVPFVFTALVNGTESTPISVYRAFTNLTLKVMSPLPTAPQGLTATFGDSAVTLSWDEPNDGTITEHKYRTRAGDEGWGEWADIPNSGAGAANSTSHTDGGLTNGVSHSFQVRGVNATGPGASSEVVTTTPRDAPEFKPESTEGM